MDINLKSERSGWDEYFLKIALAVSERSTCMRRKYGAVIVNDNIIISTGYNGAPRGEMNCIDKLSCLREDLKIPKGERYELCRAVHAEQNAIINGDPVKMIGSTIYIAGYDLINGTYANGKPCLLCNRMIKNARIGKIVYYDEDMNICIENI